MNYFIKSIVLPVAFAAMASTSVSAQQPIELSGDVKVVTTTTDEAGETVTQYSAPEMVVPGDRLIFSTEYRNTGAEVVENFVVTNPLPSAVQLTNDAEPGLLVSIDGGENWGSLETLVIALEDGTTRAAQHSDVTHVRWILAVVAPGESGRLEYPAIIR